MPDEHKTKNEMADDIMEARGHIWALVVALEQAERALVIGIGHAEREEFVSYLHALSDRARRFEHRLAAEDEQ